MVTSRPLQGVIRTQEEYNGISTMNSDLQTLLHCSTDFYPRVIFQEPEHPDIFSHPFTNCLGFYLQPTP
jgi:hypothetical protein